MCSSVLKYLGGPLALFRLFILYFVFQSLFFAAVCVSSSTSREAIFFFLCHFFVCNLYSYSLLAHPFGTFPPFRISLCPFLLFYPLAVRFCILLSLPDPGVSCVSLPLFASLRLRLSPFVSLCLTFCILLPLFDHFLLLLVNRLLLSSSSYAFGFILEKTNLDRTLISSFVDWR